MNTDVVEDPKPIRLVFELARADHPRLYDDLIRFHKGTKRVNRLRVLAYDGLLAQEGLFIRVGEGQLHQPSGSFPQEGNGAVTNDLFEPAIDE